MVDLLDQQAPAGTPYAQVGTIFVRKCVHPRMVHLMRTISHEHLQKALQDADEALIQVLKTSSRWEVKSTSYQTFQVAMDLRDGGIGMRRPWNEEIVS